MPKIRQISANMVFFKRIVSWISHIKSISAKFDSPAVVSWFRNSVILLTRSDSSQQKIK